MTVGRVAVENLRRLRWTCPDQGCDRRGPQRAVLQRLYPKVRFWARRTGSTSHLAAADVLFSSLTDTFGVVQLEALACGTPSPHSGDRPAG
jgi:glycosyltransferase involved in cell wall biosynthesis